VILGSRDFDLQKRFHFNFVEFRRYYIVLNTKNKVQSYIFYIFLIPKVMTFIYSTFLPIFLSHSYDY
jgi:hypothetical protein